MDILSIAYRASFLIALQAQYKCTGWRPRQHSIVLDCTRRASKDDSLGHITIVRILNSIHTRRLAQRQLLPWGWRPTTCGSTLPSMMRHIMLLVMVVAAGLASLASGAIEPAAAASIAAADSADSTNAGPGISIQNVFSRQRRHQNGQGLLMRPKALKSRTKAPAPAKTSSRVPQGDFFNRSGPLQCMYDITHASTSKGIKKSISRSSSSMFCAKHGPIHGGAIDVWMGALATCSLPARVGEFSSACITGCSSSTVEGNCFKKSRFSYSRLQKSRPPHPSPAEELQPGHASRHLDVQHRSSCHATHNKTPFIDAKQMSHLLMLDAVAVSAVTLAEVQPCKTYPCTDNDESATLCAARSDAPDSVNGRVCSCLTPGFSYRDDLLGCVGRWGSPWV